MNHFDRYTVKPKPSQFADWLIERGIPAVTTEEAADILAIDQAQVRISLAPLRRRGALVSPARGLWIPVPLENRLTGTLDPMSYIDAMMRKLNKEYCVGWLSAAALHGVSHQAPQVFQVATDKSVSNRVVGGAELRFLARSRVADMPHTLVVRAQGAAQIASPAAVMLMLADDIIEAGGLDNVATVIAELADEYPAAIAELTECAELFPLAAARRVGWMLDAFVDSADTDALAEQCAARQDDVSMLSPHADRSGSLSKRWQLRLNRKVEPDL